MSSSNKKNDAMTSFLYSCAGWGLRQGGPTIPIEIGTPETFKAYRMNTEPPNT